MSRAEFHHQRRQKHLEQKKRFERRWEGLANIIAALIIAGFQILRSYLKLVFDLLSQGVHGFFFLIILHLSLILVLAQGL